MTFTQLAQSMTKNSCSLPVRGETLRSVRTLKMRKSADGFEPSLSQGSIMRIKFLRSLLLLPMFVGLANRHTHNKHSCHQRRKDHHPRVLTGVSGAVQV